VGYDILEWVWPTLLAWVINPCIFLVAIWLISCCEINVWNMRGMLGKSERENIRGNIKQEWQQGQTTWGNDTTLSQTRMRTGPNHMKEWHHLQPKILRHWVCGSFFLHIAQLSHSYPISLQVRVLLHIDTLSPERKHDPHLYCRLHTLKRDRASPKPMSRKLSIQDQTVLAQANKPSALIPIVRRIWRENIRGDLKQEWEQGQTT